MHLQQVIGTSPR